MLSYGHALRFGLTNAIHRGEIRRGGGGGGATNGCVWSNRIIIYAILEHGQRSTAVQPVSKMSKIQNVIMGMRIECKLGQLMGIKRISKCSVAQALDYIAVSLAAHTHFS